MTRYMLDTNIVSDLIRNPQGRAAKRIGKVGERGICTSIIVAAELRYGCAKSGSPRLRKAVEDLLGEIKRAAVRGSGRRRIRGAARGAGSNGHADRQQRPADRRSRPR